MEEQYNRKYIWSASVGIMISIFLFPVCMAVAARGADRAVVVAMSDPSPSFTGIVRWPRPVDFETARSLASDLGGTLVSIPDGKSNELLTCLRNLSDIGLGPCDGPWIGLERPAAPLPGIDWRWIDLVPVTYTRWSEECPSTSVRIPAAAALLGDGSWVDSITTTEAGSEIRSAAFVWPASSDEDGDGIPDPLAASGVPTVVVEPTACRGNRADLDGNGRVDSADLAIVLAAWGTAERLPDINDDGLVDPLDLGEVLAAWTVN